MPEVEAVCRRLRNEATGATITGVRILRPRMVTGELSIVTGTRLERIERLGKNILLHLDNGARVQIHLRMTGSLYVIPDARFLVATIRAVFDLAGGRGLVLEDTRALARIQRLDASESPAIGIDPLSPEFTPDHLANLAQATRRPSKVFLLDQTQIAGLGNIYSAEILFAAAIDPRRAMNSLSGQEIARLHTAIQHVLTEAITTAEIYYLRPGHFQQEEQKRLAVYGREGEPCRVCGQPILRIAQAARSTWFCPHCQK